MKPSNYTRPALLLSLVLALPFSRARADDSAPSAPPPAVPGAPETSPADGTAPAPAHRRHMRPGYVLADLTTKLTLTADQQKIVGKVIEDGRSQLKELRGDASLTPADKGAKMREVNASTRGQIRAALTPDQQKLFDALPANEGKGQAHTEVTPPAQN
jgi:hypothetical protein